MAIKGVDISEWQDGLSLKKVKEAGYEFAILRSSATGYAGSGTNKFVDARFEKFYKEAKEIGLNVGAYHYSCANTRQKGIDEANYMYQNCLKGKQFEYPIFIDVENNQWQTKDKKGVTDAIIGFCETLENLGYFVGIYANLNFFNNYIDNSRLNSYMRWLACWTTVKPSTNFKYTMWQYTSKLSISGVTVDGDYSYTDYAKVIKEAGLNGFKKEEDQQDPEPVTPDVLILAKGDTFTIKEINKDIITIEKKEA